MAKEEASKEEKQREEESRRTFDIPAIYANRFFITSGAYIRITFSEQKIGTEIVSHRGAFLTHPQDAIKLRDLLTKMLEPYEEIFASIEQEEQKKQEQGEKKDG